jgi:hypothetical protein
MKAVSHEICQAVLMQVHIFIDMTAVICQQFVAPLLGRTHPEANAATSSKITHFNCSPIKTTSTPKQLILHINTAFKSIILDIRMKTQIL